MLSRHSRGFIAVSVAPGAKPHQRAWFVHNKGERRMTLEEALAMVRQIEGLASTARRDDPAAQDGILFLVKRLREAPGVPDVVREKVASIAAWTEILFSDRKRDTYGGDVEVTELLLHDCERLRAAIRGD